MVNRPVLLRRLQALEQYLGRLERLASTPLDRYLENDTLQAACERWLHLAAESVLDVANHVIASRGLPPPEGYADTFRVLCDAGVLEPGLSSRLAAFARLRNILVHDYLRIDSKLIHASVAEGLKDLREFGRIVASMLEEAES
ncbi:MAG: DUF86 domain-containing protein [Candidatus Wallbacteria bacterium]|nr:DUF86 domain-containing protein [Candidatus Wallbacteria bacterium]